MIAAPLVTCAVIGVGLALSEDAVKDVDLASQAKVNLGAATAARVVPLSRAAERQAAVPAVTGRLWSTADLDLRLDPKKNARTKGEVDSLSKVAVTGVRRNGFAQVIVNKRVYWVTDDYLAKKKPTSPANLPVVDRPCPGTSGVEGGLTAAADRVYRAVCNNFPQITSYGGRDGHGEHSTGRAIDIMVSDPKIGNAIAEFLRANAAEFNLYNVIYRQRIFTQERAGEGWRSMSNRGSATANHFDHVHVSVY